MYKFTEEINQKHRHLLLTACETAKKKLESNHHLNTPEQNHHYSQSTSIKELNKKVSITKKSQDKQLENQTFHKYKHQISTIIQKHPISPKKSHSLSTLGIRLSRVKSFQIAKEELETTNTKDQLEKINKRLENSVIKNKEYLKSRKNSALRTRKISRFSEKSSFAKDEDQISLLEKIVLKRNASQIRKNNIVQELRENVKKKQEKQKILNQKIKERIKEFKLNAMEKYLQVEKNLEKIEETRKSHRSLLKSYSKHLNSKHKLKELSVLKNNQALKQQHLNERNGIINKILSAKSYQSQLSSEKAEKLLKYRSNSLIRMRETENFHQNLNFITSCRSLTQLNSYIKQLSILPKASTPPSEPIFTVSTTTKLI